MNIEIWVTLDANGDYACGVSDDDCDEKYAENIGGTVARRMVKVVLTMPIPVPVVLRGTVLAESDAELELIVD